MSRASPATMTLDDLDRRELLVLARRFHASPLDLVAARVTRARQVADRARQLWQHDCQVSAWAHRAAAQTGKNHGCTSPEFAAAFAEARSAHRLGQISQRAVARALGDLARAEAGYRKQIKQEPKP